MSFLTCDVTPADTASCEGQAPSRDAAAWRPGQAARGNTFMKCCWARRGVECLRRRVLLRYEKILRAQETTGRIIAELLRRRKDCILVLSI